MLGVTDATAKRRAVDLIDETGNSGIRLLDSLDGPARRSLLDSDAIETDELVAATRKYGDLDSAKRSQFRQLLADDGVRDSWVRAAGDADVSKEAVVTALKQVDSVEDDVSITSFKPAADIDVDSDPYYSSWYENPRDPYDDDTIVIDGTADDSLSVYRFWDSTRNNHEAGPWVTDAEDIDRLRSSGDATAEDIIDRYALFEDADKVTRFDVDEGTSVRISEVGEQPGRNGGGLQYELRGDDMMDESSELKLDDLPASKGGQWDTGEFLNGEAA